MKYLNLGIVLLAASVLGAGCSGAYGTINSTSRLVITMQAQADVGTRAKPYPLSFDPSPPLTVKITAMRADGQVDSTYNGFVRLSVKPGSVVDVSGDPARISGRNVLLQRGVAENIGVSVAASYGPTHLWVEDIGYTPVDPARTPPPKCSNGQDDNGNGVVDFPADPGCAFANDDNEDLGTYAGGASSTIWFVSPRIADVRGVTQGGAATSFPHQQVTIDTGWRDQTTSFEFNTIVTRIASDGFYVTDLGDPRGFTSVFAYNFSSPPRMRICDRLKAFGGTASDFFGFTEIGFPTWELEEWNPAARPCLIPDARVLSATDVERNTTDGSYSSTGVLLSQIAALVRLEGHADSDPKKAVDLHVSQHFGPGFPKAETSYAPEDNATNCDINQDGKVDFNTDPEKACAANCATDIDCTEYSNFQQRSAFTLVIDAPDPNTGVRVRGAIQADASTSAEFDPVALRGQRIRAFTGTLRYFSGGTQFTVEARCADDITIAMDAQPIGSDRACVHARTDSENNSASN